MPTQSAPVAGPITYMLDGVQYIAVNAGWGGGAAQIERGAGVELPRASARLLVFKLGGTAVLPAMKPEEEAPEPPPLRASEVQVAAGGRTLFARTCAICHGQRAVGGVKDLRKMSKETHAQFNDIVLGGARKDKGHGQLRRHPQQGRCGSHPRLSDRAGQRGLGPQAGRQRR